MIPRQFLITVIILFALTIAMSVYVWQLRRREIRSPQLTEKNEHVAPPASGAMERVTVYVAYDSVGELMSLYTAKDSTHPLTAGAEIRQVFLVDPGIAVVDVNSAFVEGQVSGVLPEELTIASLVQTLATNMPELARVKILVDGKEQETLAGHADLTGFYDVQQIAEVAKQLSAQ
jgi:hypothetical protein